MGLRYLGNINKPGYNPLASNITTGVNVVQYQGIFTTQQQLQAITTGQWVTEPLFDYSTLLLQADGIANGSQNNTFLDSSSNNFTITRNGNTTQGTFSPFSQTGWGNYFGGSSNLATPSSANLTLGTGDFSISAWIFPTASATAATGILGIGNGEVSGTLSIFTKFPTAGDNTIVVNSYFGTTVTTTGVVNVNAWNHIALSRASGTLSVYVNGTRVANTSFNAANDNLSGTTLVIGRSYANLSQEYFTGYISDVRVVKGTALYSGTTITVPTAFSTAITNTQLLTCQSNRFVDNSTNAFAITVNGTPSVQAFSPFAPQFQYTASGTGGSGYFDGTGDYLQLTSPTSAVAMGSGDFTFSAWIYPTAFTSPVAGILDIANAGNATRFGVILYANGKIYVDNNTNLLISANAVPLNAWTYVSVVRSGSTMTIYYNGVSQASGTVTQSFTDTTTYIGRSFDGYYFQGYIAGMRLVKGSALSATTPTTPPTAITNTSLLLNFTNAGIYDATMKNNLETVGNAQISTSVVKYGSGSMYFDGNGDYLIAPNSKLYAFQSGDFTVEMWIYPSTVSAVQYLFDTRDPASTTSAGIQWYINASAKLGVYVGTTSVITASTSSISANTWTHLALVKNGSTWKIYINGTADATTGTNSTALTQEFLTIACSCNQRAATTTDKYSGYIDDLRITNGVARYTSNFIPPSVALPRQ